MSNLLGDLTSWIDSKKRIAADRVSTLLSDPATLATRAVSDVEQQYQPLIDAAMQGDTAGIINSGLLGPLQTVWHGSPHLFDKFDASKIGTGEGAQAYGHGLYFSEAPQVAGSYRDFLGGKGVKYPTGEVINAKTTVGTPAQVINYVDYLSGAPGVTDPIAKAIENIQKRPSIMQDPKGALAWLKNFQESGAQFGKTGTLYKVDLPDEMIPKMLDWDKPLSEQSAEVRAILEKHGLKGDKLPFGVSLVGGAGDSGASIYKYLASKGGKYSEQNASDVMKKIGIPGIRYLDAGSRGTGKGTYNYVVFPGNEDLLKILERQ